MAGDATNGLRSAWLRLAVLLCALRGAAWAAPEPAAAKDEPGTELYYSANALYNRGLFHVAIKEFEAFLKAYPQHSKAEQAKYGLALSCYSMGEYRQAESLLKQVVEKGAAGDRNELNLLRAHCLLQLGNAADAAAAFSAVLDAPGAEAGRESALAGLAETAFRQQKWADVIAWSDKVLAANPSDDNRKRALYQGAWARHETKKFDEAIERLGRLTGLLEEGDPLKSQAAYLLGECYRQTGRLTDASAQYDQAAKGAPSDAAGEILYRQGYVAMLEGKYDQALTAFDAAVKASPKAPYVEFAQLYVGRCWLEKGDHDRAKRTFEQLGQGSGVTSASATLWLGRTYSRQKRHSDAIRVLEPALARFKSDPLLPDLMYDHANALIAKEQFGDAARLLAQLAQRTEWPQHNDVLRLYAVCLHKAGDYANSLKYAEGFLAAYKEDKLLAEVAFVRGENLFLLSRLDECIAAHREFTATYPGHASADAAAFRIAQVLHVQGKWQAALDAAKPLLDKGVQGDVFSQMGFVVGDSLFRLEKWEEASEALRAFVKAYGDKPRRQRDASEFWEPNVDAALIELAVASQRMGKPDQAGKYLGSMLSWHGKSGHAPLAMVELGRLQYENKEYTNARETLKKFLQAHPKAPQRGQAEYYIAWSYLAENQHGEAVEYFASVVKSYPKDAVAPDAMLQLGLIQIEQEKYREAQATFQRLRQEYPDHPRMDLATFSQGVAFARPKEWERAAPYFQRVVDTYPKSDVAPRALYEAAWCERGLARPAEAAKRYQALLEKYPQSDLCEPATTELAELTFDDKKYDEVIAQLQSSLEGMKDRALREQTLYRLATAYFNKNDFAQSAGTFESFLKEFPKSVLRASAQFQAGESRMKLKETEAARDHFDAARLTSDAKIRELALLRLGEARGLTRQWRESEQTYEELLKAFPTTKWARRAAFGIGWAHEKQKDYAGAITEYRKVLSDKAKDELAARAQFQIGECLFAEQKYDAAIQELVRVQVNYGFKDWTAKALLEIGRSLEAKGDADRAMEQFSEVIRRFPGHDAAVVAKERLDVLRRQK